MRTITRRIASLVELNRELGRNKMWANGKNIRVDHLHTTCAESPRDYENIAGVYVTRPEYAWMGAWMAVTSRSNLQKRHLRYCPPLTDYGDHLGKVQIYSPQEEIDSLFCTEAYLYLFDPQRLWTDNKIDCSGLSAKYKTDFLQGRGFDPGIFERRGKQQPTFILPTGEQAVVTIDEWQVALVNFGRIIPDVELIIKAEAIAEMKARVERVGEPIGDKYLLKG